VVSLAAEMQQFASFDFKERALDFKERALASRQMIFEDERLLFEALSCRMQMR